MRTGRPLVVLGVCACIVWLLSASLAFAEVIDPAQPNVVRFDPQEARYVRFVITATQPAGQPCLDELEVYGVDGEACTADDEPAITIPPICLPYTTSTATVTLPDASYYSPASYPISPIDGVINPPPRTGLPVTCVDGVPSTTSGARFQGVFASKDTARWDEATEVTINCE